MAQVAAAPLRPSALLIEDPPDQLDWVYSDEGGNLIASSSHASPQTYGGDTSKRRALSTSCSSITRGQRCMEATLGDAFGDVDSLQYQLQQLQAQLAAEVEARAASEEEAYVLESKLLELQQAAQTAQMQLQRVQSARDSLLAENRMLQEMLFEANEEQQAAEVELKKALDELEGRSTGNGLVARVSHIGSLVAVTSEASSTCCTAVSSNGSSSTRDQAVQAALPLPLCLSQTNLSCLNKQQENQLQGSHAWPVTSDAEDDHCSEQECPLTARYTPAVKPTAGGPPSLAEAECVEASPRSIHTMLAALRIENEDLAGQLVAKSLECALLRERQEEERHHRALLETVNLRLMKKVERLSELMTDRQLARI